jgi:hypothetical protein
MNEILDLLSAISKSVCHELLGGCKKGRRDSASLGLIKGGEGGAWIWLGIRKFLGGLKIGSTDFTLSYRGVK